MAIAENDIGGSWKIGPETEYKIRYFRLHIKTEENDRFSLSLEC